MPKVKCKYSLESENGFIFDMGEVGHDEEVIGIEIFINYNTYYYLC